MRIPKHLGIIPDGNRTWAKNKGISLLEGYSIGTEKLKEIIKYAIEKYNIKYISVYALSVENFFKRSKEEIKSLKSLFIEEFRKLLDNKFFEEKGVRVSIIGNRKIIDEDLLRVAEKVEKKTRKYSSFFVNVLLGYGGRNEIIEGIREMLERHNKEYIVENLDEEFFSSFLFSKDLPDVDLIIRTKEKRISNFLLWKSAYAELIFFDKLWPEFTKEDLGYALREYARRKRNFGK